MRQSATLSNGPAHLQARQNVRRQKWKIFNFVLFSYLFFFSTKSSALFSLIDRLHEVKM